MEQHQINKEIQGEVLCLSWNNRRVRKDGWAFIFLVIFWIIWAPVTLGITALLISGQGLRIFFLVWLIFGWAGTILVPYTLLKRRWSEWISVSPDAVSFGQVGFLAPKPKNLKIATILEIVIGYCNDSVDGESMVTLNMYYRASGWRNGRHMLAYWLSPELKEEVFRSIQEFATTAKIPLKFRRFG